MELTLTENEIFIIKLLRELNPFERIEIVKDANGKVDNFIVHKSQKIVLTNIAPRNVR